MAFTNNQIRKCSPFNRVRWIDTVPFYTQVPQCPEGEERDPPGAGQGERAEAAGRRRLRQPRRREAHRRLDQHRLQKVCRSRHGGGGGAAGVLGQDGGDHEEEADGLQGRHWWGLWA